MTSRILSALGLGILVGLFFGESAASLKVLGNIYIGLMQMAVLPYITFSLILAIGRLKFQQMKRIILTSAFFYVALYVVAALVVVCVSASFPSSITRHHFDITPSPPPEHGDLLDFFIPSNPFRALSENAVPAVVIFSLLFGFAIINLPNKRDLLNPLQVVVDGLKQVNAMILKLTPLGIFSMAANLAGTMTLEELQRLQAYYLTFGLAVLILSFAILPGLVSLLTPFSYKEIVRTTRNPMLMAFVTGSVFPVMPILSESTRALLEKIPDRRKQEEQTEKLNDVLLPLAYPFPSSNNVVDLLFIPFAAWFIGKSLSLFDTFSMVGSGFFLLFGKVYLTIPFLLNYFHLPESLFQVFLGAGILAARMGDFLGPMHYCAFVLMTAAYLRGYFHVRWRVFLPLATASTLLLAVGPSLLHLKIQNIDEKVSGAQASLPLPHVSLSVVVPTTEVAASPNPLRLQPGESRLQRALKRGLLRVGFRENHRPFSFRDHEGNLTGLDIDLAHRFAAELGLSIEWVPYQIENLAGHFHKDHFDIAISGLQDSIQFASSHRMSNPYLSARIAIITKDYLKEKTEDLFQPSSHRQTRWSIDRNDLFTPRLASLFPHLNLIPMESIVPFFTDQRLGLEGLITNDIIGLSWIKLMPGFSIQYPKQMTERIPFAFAIGGRDGELTDLLNDWIKIKKQDQTLENLYALWILGSPAEKTKPPRWSIARNLLNWDL